MFWRTGLNLWTFLGQFGWIHSVYPGRLTTGQFVWILWKICVWTWWATWTFYWSTELCASACWVLSTLTTHMCGCFSTTEMDWRCFSLLPFSALFSNIFAGWKAFRGKRQIKRLWVTTSAIFFFQLCEIFEVLPAVKCNGSFKNNRKGDSTGIRTLPPDGLSKDFFFFFNPKEITSILPLYKPH